MKTIQQHDTTPIFAFAAVLFMAVLTFLLILSAGQVPEQVNQFLVEVLSACKDEMNKCYGL